MGAALPATARAQAPPIIMPPIAPPPPPASRLPPPRIDKTKHYYLFFDQIIDVGSMRGLRRQLATLVEAGVSEITLVLNSPGGAIEPMLITYSFIQSLPAKINTHAQGFVQSAATLLYLAGEARSSDRFARFLFHPSAQSLTAGTYNEQQTRERVTSFEAFIEVQAQILQDRTALAPAEIDRFTRETVVYTAQQAQAAGVVQTIADLRIPADTARIMFQE
jgi:ATP-dependent Clp protease protease subunit